ncbi:MAG: glutathione S-transferase family protein [Pseudomonadota bacterium]
MEVYADPITVNSRKVLAGLQMLEVDYTLNHVNYMAGEHTQKPYTTINPNAALPALVDGDLMLWESNAILQYAADKHGKTAFYPTDLATRADVNRWLLWECSAWFPSCYLYLVENCVKPLLKDTTDHAALENEAPNFNKLAGILDARLAASAWLCGEHPTIADIAVAAPMHLHGWSKLPLDPHPNLRRWITNNVEALSAWQATRVEEGFTLASTA